MTYKPSQEDVETYCKFIAIDLEGYFVDYKNRQIRIVATCHNTIDFKSFEDKLTFLRLRDKLTGK